MTKIMLVEDDKSLREIYGIRLLAEGYEIKSAGDGEEALAMAIKEQPDLIISDVMMPKISGFDMLDILRSTPETKDIKVIMMTALSSEDQRTRGESLGANRYLVKSQVGIEDVVRTVHDVLADMPSLNTDKKPDAPAPAFGAPAPTPIPSERKVTEQPSTEVTQPYTDTPVADQAPASTMPQPTAPFSSPAPASLTNSMNTAAAEPEQPEPVTEPIPAPEPVMPQTLTPQPEPQEDPEPTPAPAPQAPAAPAPAYNPEPVAAPEPTAPASEPVFPQAPVQPAAPTPAPQPEPATPQTPAAPAPTPAEDTDMINRMTEELNRDLNAIQNPTPPPTDIPTKE
jgi:CheY-like chemotaxis protein